MKSIGYRKILMVLLAMAVLLSAAPMAQAAPVSIRCWVEKADFQADPGDPATDPTDLVNFELYDTQTGSTPAPYLTSPMLGRRFAKLISSQAAEDGSIDAYYARGTFTYVFDVANPKGEMTINGVTYVGGDPQQYTVQGKYEQQILIPTLENGLLPVNTDPAMPEAYCAGWTLDSRTGEKRLMTGALAVTDDMLPTDTMPYDGLTFTLTATWFNGSDEFVLTSWYEQMATEANAEGLNRMTYNGKTYVNYPATDYDVKLPKGSKPSAQSVAGLKLVASIAPDETLPYPEGSTWQFLYDREQYTLSFDTGGAGSLKSQSKIPYQENLGMYDPGWGENTTRTEGGATYKFAGWYYNGELVGYSLAALYMPPFDLTLVAQWEKQ